MESCAPGVHFINTKRRRFKGQNMAFKRQKWCLTFSKFHKTILAFKMPKCSVFITNIGVLNAKKEGVYNAKKRSVLNAHILAF